MPRLPGEPGHLCRIDCQVLSRLMGIRGEDTTEPGLSQAAMLAVLAGYRGWRGLFFLRAIAPMGEFSNRIAWDLHSVHNFAGIR